MLLGLQTKRQICRYLFITDAVKPSRPQLVVIQLQNYSWTAVLAAARVRRHCVAAQKVAHHATAEGVH